MIFKLGKCYHHVSGREIKIVGLAETTVWGSCLVGEGKSGTLYPVGRSEDATEWIEITEEKWMKNYNEARSDW
jgi:hypothetical protein